MRHAAIVRPAARRDLRALAEWLRKEADPDTAAKVIAAARSSFDLLAETPGLGAPADAKADELAEARRWHVRGYSTYLIFYEPRRRGGVIILRVLHTSQDWKRR